MKRLSVLFVLIAVACSPAKKENDGVDSTQVAADTATITQTSEEPAEAVQSAPSTIYPELIDTPFTNDAREAAVVRPLFALLKQYDSDKYSALSGNYSLEYKEEIGPDDTETVTENQTRTWYFDSLYNLKCYVLNYEFHGSNGGHPPSMKAIYLFSNDSLIAVYSDQVGVYESGKISIRSVAGRVKVGVVLTEKRDSGVDTRNYYELTELVKLSDTFFAEYRSVVQWLKKSKRPAGDGDPYTFTMERGTGDKAFSEEFILGADVYNKIVTK